MKAPVKNKINFRNVVEFYCKVYYLETCFGFIKLITSIDRSYGQYTSSQCRIYLNKQWYA